MWGDHKAEGVGVEVVLPVPGAWASWWEVRRRGRGLGPRLLL